MALTNDANAAAIGEMTYGVARGMKNFIMITLGTSVGSGIVVDGKLVYGSDGFAAFSSPDALVFFGGLTKAGELIMKPIRESYDSNVLPLYKGKAQFLVSGLDGSTAAVLGASAVGWEI